MHEVNCRNRTKTENRPLSFVSFVKSNFDDPRDQIAISFGSRLWEEGLR